MPRGDRTGPGGMGSMTGRGMGFCSGSGAPGFANRVAGFVRGAFGGGGRGGGRGMGRGFSQAGFQQYPQFTNPGYSQGTAPSMGYSKDDEKGYLKEQAEFLKRELDGISSRLNDLDSEE